MTYELTYQATIDHATSAGWTKSEISELIEYSRNPEEALESFCKTEEERVEARVEEDFNAQADALSLQCCDTTPYDISDHREFGSDSMVNTQAFDTARAKFLRAKSETTKNQQIADEAIDSTVEQIEELLDAHTDENGRYHPRDGEVQG